MKNYLTLITLLLLSSKLSAQPGFMGKKYSFGYQFEIFPSMGLLGDIRSEDPDNRTVFTTGHHFNASAVLNRKWEFIVNYGIISPKVYAHEGEIVSWNSDGDYSSYYFNPLEKFIPTQMKLIQTNFRVYLGDNIAPVGDFMQFGIGYVTANFHPDAKRINGDNEMGSSGYFSGEDNTRTYRTMLISGIPNRKYLRLNYGFGMKRLLFSSFYALTSTNLNLNIGIKNEFQDSDITSEETKNKIGSEKHYLNTVLLRGLRSNCILEFNIGFGIIL